MSVYAEEEKIQIQNAYEQMLADISPQVFEPKQLTEIEKAYRYCLEKYDGK